MLFLAMRQLASKKKQTILILLGISFGTMLFITISGIQLGLREFIIKSLLNNTAHILISGREDIIKRDDVNEWFFPSKQVHWLSAPYGKRGESKLENYQGWADRLSHDPEVFDFSPRLNIQVILKKGAIVHNVSLTGTIPRKQLRISEIESDMVEGSFSDLDSGGGKIVIGTGVADELGVRPGQFIDVVTGKKGLRESFKVVGTISLGDDYIDKTIAFAHLTDVQKLNNSPGRISEIAVALVDIDISEKLAQRWSLFSRDKVQDWKKANPMIMDVIMMQDGVRYFITVAVLVVAAFGIYNVLSILINQKKKEIAILRSIGYGPQKILELIMYQGLFLGISGGIVGIILGLIICRLVESIDLSIKIGDGNHLLVSYAPSIYITAFASALFASIVASLLPAMSASKMTPIDIIREE